MCCSQLVISTSIELRMGFGMDVILRDARDSGKNANNGLSFGGTAGEGEWGIKDIGSIQGLRVSGGLSISLTWLTCTRAPCSVHGILARFWRKKKDTHEIGGEWGGYRDKGVASMKQEEALLLPSLVFLQTRKLTWIMIAISPQSPWFHRSHAVCKRGLLTYWQNCA